MNIIYKFVLDKLMRVQIRYKKHEHEKTLKKIDDFFEKKNKFDELVDKGLIEHNEPNFKIYVDYLFKKSEFEQYEIDAFEKMYKMIYNTLIS